MVSFVSCVGKILFFNDEFLILVAEKYSGHISSVHFLRNLIAATYSRVK